MTEWRFANFAFKVSRIRWLTIQYDVARCFTQDELQLLRGQSSCRERERTTAVSRTGKWILQEYITPTCSAAATSTKIPQQAVKKATIKSTGHETQRTKDCDLLRESCKARTSNFSVEMKNAKFPTWSRKHSLRSYKSFYFYRRFLARIQL